MCNPTTSRGVERDLMRFLKVYQVCVEGDEEGLLTRDKHFQPLGTDYAAEITGRSKKYIQNTVSVFSEQHPPGLKEFYRLLRSGMDTMVIDELLRPLGMAAYKLPQHVEVGDGGLAARVLELSKEVGDVFAEIQNACLIDSELSTKISAKEAARIEREALEVLPAVLQLIALMKQGGKA